MNNTVIAAIAWVGLAVHLVVAAVAWRSGAARPLVPLVNLITASCVVLYWAQRWYGYLFRGITWYATDQLLPVYALLVCALAAATLAGRVNATTVNGLVLLVHTVVLVLAALYLTFFRIKLF